ncbi:MAG: phosphoribosylanthranilate isomerase [Bacteroidia bacterium]|nr:phosphoribosylanthranilate isomerase [Bacteroidia bacterium]
MREPKNVLEVAELKPDLMGFIFYPDSPRYAAGILDPEILSRVPPYIRKAGVFVNTDFEEITGTVNKYSLDIVQLHGKESPELCRRLREKGIKVIKAFNIMESDNLRICSEFITCTNYFLFDVLTSNYGGSGNRFDWKILDKYDLGHPFFLSGGITPRDVKSILEITNPAFYGIDLNSRFEVKPGFKDIIALKKFISDIRLNHKSL